MGELPPGQRAIDFFPRFGTATYANRLPDVPADLEIVVEAEDGSGCGRIGLEELGRLPRREVVADFHCVTTWTRRGLSWSGYAFRDFHERLLVPRARMECEYLQFRAL